MRINLSNPEVKFLTDIERKFSELREEHQRAILSIAKSRGLDISKFVDFRTNYEEKEIEFIEAPKSNEQ